jgi:hypothetical protein
MKNKKRNLKQMIALGSKTAKGGFKNEQKVVVPQTLTKTATSSVVATPQQPAVINPVVPRASSILPTIIKRSTHSSGNDSNYVEWNDD